MTEVRKPLFVSMFDWGFHHFIINTTNKVYEFLRKIFQYDRLLDDLASAGAAGHKWTLWILKRTSSREQTGLGISANIVTL